MLVGVKLSKYVQELYSDSSEWTQVEKIANDLYGHLNMENSLRLIKEANRPGHSSSEIQDTFLEYANELGFESEKKGLFASIDLALRPDYYLPLNKTGIILEVERGKTTNNNMDLLDFWKCHLCPVADYLFLLVPMALRQNEQMKPRNEYATVDRRLAEFFRSENYTNVRGLCLYGY